MSTNKEQKPDTPEETPVTEEKSASEKTIEEQVDAIISARIDAVIADATAKANELIAKAQEQADGILSDSKKSLEASTSVKSEPVKEPDPLEEYVVVQLFKDSKDYKDDVYVAVNGENCQIKRGVPVKIKRKFAEVLEQSQIQSLKSADYQEKEQAKATAAVALGVL